MTSEKSVHSIGQTITAKIRNTVQYIHFFFNFISTKQSNFMFFSRYLIIIIIKYENII